MAALTGNSVGSSYLGLLKTTDNAAIGATEKNLTDGAGNATTLSMGTASASFTGTLDLSGATVTGLPSAAGLIENPSVSTAIQSDLTDQPAVASGFGSVALGRNADATNDSSIAIGNYSDSGGSKSIAIGSEVTANGSGGIAFGWSTQANGNRGVAIGAQAKANRTGSIAIGDTAGYLGPTTDNYVSIGKYNGFQAGANSVQVGYYSAAKATSSIAIGDNARVDTSAYTNAIAIGHDTDALAAGAVALGNTIQASIADTVSLNALEVQSNTGGIILYSPNGTQYRVTVTDAGALLVSGV